MFVSFDFDHPPLVGGSRRSGRTAQVHRDNGPLVAFRSPTTPTPPAPAGRGPRRSPPGWLVALLGREDASGLQTLEGSFSAVSMPNFASKYAFEAAFESFQLRRQMKNELNFPPNFEGLVLGCIDADFCK